MFAGNDDYDDDEESIVIIIQENFSHPPSAPTKKNVRHAIYCTVYTVHYAYVSRRNRKKAQVVQIKINAWNTFCHIIYMDFIVIFTRYRMVNGTLLSYSFLECFHKISMRKPFKSVIEQFFLFSIFFFFFLFSLHPILNYYLPFPLHLCHICANACKHNKRNKLNGFPPTTLYWVLLVNAWSTVKRYK